jgi:N-acyl homoserine lactone hydrolase
VAHLREMPLIVRLDLAEVRLPESHPATADSRVPVYGFLVLHPDGPILVDTGVGFGNHFIDELYRPERAVLAEVLDRSGIELARIVAVVNSHLHFDHCGQNPALFESQTEFFAQSAEFEQVHRDRYYTDAAWALAPEHQRRVVRGDESIADGVTLIATPGHSRGHQSVVVRGGGRCVVIVPSLCGTPRSSGRRSPVRRTSIPTTNCKWRPSTRFVGSRRSNPRSSTSATASN